MNEREVYVEIGRRIRLIRRWRKLTQAELARRMHIGRPSVTNAESGLQHMPVWNLLQIAEILNVPPHVWLLTPDNWAAWCKQEGVTNRHRVRKLVERLRWVEEEREAV